MMLDRQTGRGKNLKILIRKIGRGKSLIKRVGRGKDLIKSKKMFRSSCLQFVRKKLINLGNL